MDPSILKQYIFQKGFVTEAAKARREAEAQNATLQARDLLLGKGPKPLLLSCLRQARSRSDGKR